MVFVTGDTHRTLDSKKLSLEKFVEGRNLTKDDYVIVCGDFGFTWDNSPYEICEREHLCTLPYTILFIDGNHENFDLLKTFPEIEMFGGTVRQIASSVFHLKRGQVLNIDGNSIFVMGGATSHDRHARKEGTEWWPEEIPSKEEFEQGLDALDACGWKVDYVITHCTPRSIQIMIDKYFINDDLTKYLERVKEDLIFKKWYFGHYHMDKDMTDKFRLIYDDIIRLGE